MYSFQDVEGNKSHQPVESENLGKSLTGNIFSFSNINEPSLASLEV